MSINFKINDIPVSAAAGEMISDVAARFGIDIPTLCHDPKVKSYGACGMCVIEAKGGGKLLRSCSTEVNERTEGMEYYTETPRVVQARKVALELLMTDHTGDCRPPCMLACPAETDCQGYVGLIANGMDEEAVRLVMEKIPLPASIDHAYTVSHKGGDRHDRWMQEAESSPSPGEQLLRPYRLQ